MSVNKDITAMTELSDPPSYVKLYMLEVKTFQDPFVFSLNSIPWVRSSSDSSDKFGYMETGVDLRVRSDTAKPNSSPYVSVPSFIG